MNLQMPVRSQNNPVAVAAPAYYTPLLQVQGWRHRISARGGFDTASFSIADLQEEYLEDWLVNGLGRHIVRYDHIGQIMWEGYVHSVTITIPGRQISRTLENLANFVQVSYTLTDYDDCSQISGETLLTGRRTDTQSQDTYGIAKVIFSVGQATTTEAEAERDLHLDLYSQPAREIRDIQENKLDLTVECRGYSHWYKKVYFTRSVTSPSTTNASTIIGLLVPGTVATGLTQNYIDTREVQTNTFQVQNFYDAIDQWNSWDLLNKISDKGDGTNIWNWMVLERRRFYYRPVPIEIAYMRNIHDPWHRVYTPTGTLVYPWQIRPDNYIRTPDSFQITTDRNTDLLQDSSVQYIHAVEWSEDMPFAYQLEHQPTDSLKAKLKGVSLGVSF